MPSISIIKGFTWGNLDLIPITYSYFELAVKQPTINVNEGSFNGAIISRDSIWLGKFEPNEIVSLVISKKYSTACISSCLFSEAALKLSLELPLLLKTYFSNKL